MLLDPNITYISLQQLTEVRRKSAMKILEFSGHFIIMMMMIMMMIMMMTVTVMIIIIIIIIIIIMLFLMLMMVMVMTVIVIVKMIITIVNDFLLSQCLFYSVTCFTMLTL